MSAGGAASDVHAAQAAGKLVRSGIAALISRRLQTSKICCWRCSSCPCPPTIATPPLAIFFFFLQDTLQPTSLDIKNDSNKHAGHTGNPTGAPDAETHFTSVWGCDGGFGTSGALRAGVAVCCGAGWLRCAEGLGPWLLEQSPLACPVLPWLVSLALGSSRTLFGLRRVTIVSSAFEGKNPVQRHRWAAAPCNLLVSHLFGCTG